MLFPPSALERAMQIKEVLLRAMNKEYSWLRAAEILGITARGLRHMRKRMEQFGYQGLVDMRRGRPSPRRTPVKEIERILQLYRECYAGFNVRHFCATVRREHDVKLSYGCVKQILQGAGLIEKGRSRGRHRMRRERKPRFGQMLHLDGSPHAWLTLVPEERQTLIQSVDDATSRLLYAQLWPAETTRAVMTAISDLVRGYGIPESLYTDRASWAFETPKAGGKVSKTQLTQVGEALERLGVEHIASYSPQGRGRSERMNRTLQDRLVKELRVAGITTLEAANRYLRERYIPTHNEEFACQPADPTSAFVEVGDVNLDEIFFEYADRTVGKDNTVSLDGAVLQLAKQPGRASCAGIGVQVRRHLDGSYTIRRGIQLLGRYADDARPLAAPMEAAAPVGNRQRRRFPTRSLDAGQRPPAPTASTGERVKQVATDNGRAEERFTASTADALRAKAVDGPSKQSRGSAAHSFPSVERPRRRTGPRLPRFQRVANF
jgi:molybdenum-dependent DNA-binding transcriptional regulator ModE